MTGKNVNLTAPNFVTINNTVAANGGSLNISTSNLSGSNYILNADNISISSPVGTGLSIGGFGGGTTFNAINGITVQAAANDLTLQGTIAYNGPTFLIANGAGQSIQAAGSTSTASSQSLLITNSLVGGTIGANFTPGGNWTLTNGLGGSFANSGGPVTLSGVFNFGGKDFAIISTGDINLTGATINLDGATNGGNLTILAGYDFLPLTGGQQTFTSNAITNITANVTGGSILEVVQISALEDLVVRVGLFKSALIKAQLILAIFKPTALPLVAT